MLAERVKKVSRALAERVERKRAAPCRQMPVWCFPVVTRVVGSSAVPWEKSFGIAGSRNFSGVFCCKIPMEDK